MTGSLEALDATWTFIKFDICAMSSVVFANTHIVSILRSSRRLSSPRASDRADHFLLAECAEAQMLEERGTEPGSRL